MHKVYSGLENLPEGRASDHITEGCLVLEGGAFRGLYTQGFLDAMMENDINMACVIGVSAGALSGMNYISGQIGRSGRINLGFRHDSRYVGARAVLHSHSLLDIGFLTEDRGILEPFDHERFENSKQRFIAVATNCNNGKAVCFEKGRSRDIFAGVRASATMPYISPMVWIDGVPYLDGGCTCKIPYHWALQNGFQKIIVLRTRETTYRKPDKISKTALRFYRSREAFAKKLAISNKSYNRQCDEIEQLHMEGRLLRIAPSETVTVARVEGDMEKLGNLYWLGYRDGVENDALIRNYLGI